jgi:NAD(P)-dependent dehydrogenase (short-subunit alcohol dehydrogenase family)
MSGSSLAGSVALVTGAGRGIGQAIAIELAARGAHVVACARSTGQLEETAKIVTGAGGSMSIETLDVTDAAGVERLVARTADEYGPITSLVNNAGICDALGPFEKVSLADWWRDIEVNLQGSVNCAHAVLPGMYDVGTGRIVNVISAAAFNRQPLWSAYITSKSALLAFTECLGTETAGRGVSVFSLDPGLVHTALLDRAVGTGIDQVVTMFDAALQAGRNIPVEQPANIAVALCEGRGDALSGRFFDANEDFESVLARTDQILAEDLYRRSATR